MTGSLADDLEFVKALAGEAAEISLARCRSVTPEEKGNRSYVTDLDRDLETMLRARLSERFPEDSLTGEELAASGGLGPRRWSIDPIDGTGNLVHGLPLWSISLGLLDENEPVLGVIAIPPLDELYWAVRGGGAWCNDQPIRVEDTERFHPQDLICAGTTALRQVDSRSLLGRLRDLGSSCCEQAFLACGRVQAAVMLGEQVHDLAAGLVLAAEAGCRIGTIDGRAMTPAEMIGEAPVAVPTVLAPPRRLAQILLQARRLPPLLAN